jgi:hypothetical protein
MRMLTRAFRNAPRKTRSMSKAEAETCPPEFDGILVSGGDVDWRENKKIIKKYRWPVVVRISRTKTKGEYYKSVHAAKNTPGGVIVGIYLGKVVDSGSIVDGRWCAALPGYRQSKSLDSKITDDLPWEGIYLAEKAVGGFFNSSRKKPNSLISNHPGANCEIRWFYRTYDGSNINKGRVCADIFTKKSVRRGVEFLWDYNWLP